MPARTNSRTLITIALAAGALSLSACGGSSGGSSTKTSASGSTPPGSSAKVTVPSVTGQETQFAVARMQKLGLDASTRKRYGSERKGLVLKSDPPGGSLVARGTKITVFVSRGPKPVSTVSTQAPGSSGTAGSSSGTGGSSGGSGASCPSGEYVRADGSCGSVSQNGGAPADTHRGHKQIQQNPDCQNAPPPPPGYKGPVQC